ncbi:isoprenylcysteine carboxylmethyltransferase family protein [Rhizobium sp. BK377]|uniref:methyltransferase family protein n=1 Tax=Rhizobium sp. BK377 TaxID=2587058 RepID=UPI00160F475E|nr:isoprenylcysteine carboxylmethyltransferase family protein [Rhizobium sp. BK377]MBB3461765.1 protein-S-isoprenylcysteine O-methyltransferase Ste14 [Rhizobium sp. BK377]
MENGAPDLGRRAVEANAKFLVALAVMVFLTAGTLAYWQGWLFLANFAAWSAGSSAYFYYRDPALLEKRMRAGPAAETEPVQKRIQLFTGAVMIALIVVSALDYRFGWSTVPVWAIIFGNLLISTGFLFVVFVLRENTFASATIQVSEDQKVISTGPYALVRHPMYAAVLPLASGIPLALNSWWGLVIVPLIFIGLILRLLYEEHHLRQDLPGYEDYCRNVQYRLFPGIW